MGRMLNALREIESRKPCEQARGAAEAGCAGAVTVVPPAADDSLRDEAVMAALLDETEAAAEQAVAEMPLEPSESNGTTILSHDAEVVAPAGSARPRGENHEALSDPLGELADAMLRSMPRGTPGSFLFTSPDSDTLGIDLLVPLSMSLARRLDGDLLLIDANLHRPALGSRLGVEASRGLTDVLSGAASWRDVVRRTVVPGVDVVPAVPFSTPAGPPPDRLNLRPLLAEARGEYGMILVHAASLRYPEVVRIARDCEGAYLVVRLHATSRRTLRQAGPILRRAGANVLGCIVVR